MGENRVPCEGTGAPAATHRIAEARLFRWGGVGTQVYLQSMGWRVRGREISADTHITVRESYGAANPDWLERAESRIELGNHSRYSVKLCFQTVEFGIESSFTTRLHDILIINPVLMLESAIVSDHCLVSF